jgi:hypothetical protein
MEKRAQSLHLLWDNALIWPWGWSSSLGHSQAVSAFWLGHWMPKCCCVPGCILRSRSLGTLGEEGSLASSWAQAEV